MLDTAGVDEVSVGTLTERVCETVTEDKVDETEADEKVPDAVEVVKDEDPEDADDGEDECPVDAEDDGGWPGVTEYVVPLTVLVGYPEEGYPWILEVVPLCDLRIPAFASSSEIKVKLPK